MGLFETRNIDMRKMVYYKPQKTPTCVSFVDKDFRIGHTYEDFQKYMKEHPNISVVELDIVIEKQSGGNQILLTAFFHSCSLIPIILLKEKTSDCVIKTFDKLTAALEIQRSKIFPQQSEQITDRILLSCRLEYNPNGNIPTKIFFTVIQMQSSRKACLKRTMNTSAL